MGSRVNQTIREGWSTVISLFMPIVLFLTVLASVSFGVLATYATVVAILHAFGPSAQPAPSRPRLTLVPSQNHASGD
jgi:hypothetical protein